MATGGPRVREGYFIISVAARLVGVHEQTLRYYERAGLLAPARTSGNIRLYSATDLDRVAQIRRLIEDLGVNLAGVEVILRLTQRVRELEAQIERLRENRQKAVGSGQ